MSDLLKSLKKSIMMSKFQRELYLLMRHVHMLKVIRNNEPIGIIRLSEMLKEPQHKIRYSLRMLEQDGLIKPSPEGAITTKKVETFLENLKDALKGMTAEIKGLQKYTKR